MIVLEVAAYALLIVAGVAAFSSAAWILFSAVVSLWRVGNRPQIPAYSGREIGAVRDLPRRGEVVLSDWYAADQITLTELELLAEYVIWHRKTLPASVARARVVLFESLEGDPPWGTAAVPDLPVGYFDEHVSAERPENVEGWVEVQRMGRKSYWVRLRGDGGVDYRECD
jgi:hypothetical protein